MRICLLCRTDNKANQQKDEGKNWQRGKNFDLLHVDCHFLKSSRFTFNKVKQQKKN